MLILDFGLCKKLDVNQTSLLPTAQGAMAAGWHAPEILCGEVKLDNSAGDDSQSSRGSSVGTPTNSSGGGRCCKPTRLMKLVDIQYPHPHPLLSHSTHSNPNTYNYDEEGDTTEVQAAH